MEGAELPAAEKARVCVECFVGLDIVQGDVAAFSHYQSEDSKDAISTENCDYDSSKRSTEKR